MLKSVHIKNFRSCQDVKLGGLGPIAGLVGRNGAGKTTILRAIEATAHAALLTDGFSSAFDQTEVDLPQIQVTLASGEFVYEYRINRSDGEANDGERLRVRSSGDEGWTTLCDREDAAVWVPTCQYRMRHGSPRN